MADLQALGKRLMQLASDGKISDAIFTTSMCSVGVAIQVQELVAEVRQQNVLLGQLVADLSKR
jgi:hypothetical protein